MHRPEIEKEKKAKEISSHEKHSFDQLNVIRLILSTSYFNAINHSTSENPKKKKRKNK